MLARRFQSATIVRMFLLGVFTVIGSAQPSAPLSSERNLVSLRIVVGANLAQGNVSTLTLVLRRLDRHADDLRIRFNPSSAFEVRVAPGRYQLSTDQAVRWGSRWLMWDVEVPVTSPVNELQLGSHNAITFNHQPQQEVKPERVSQARNSAPKRAPRQERARKVVLDYIPPPVELSSPATPLEAAIVAVLEKWIRAVQQRNLEMLMSCYAPTLTRYFLQKNVSWHDVELDKQRFFRKFSRIRKLEIRDLRITPTPSGTEAQLTKSWDFGGDLNFSGEVVSQLVFENHNGQWLISSEREREIWVRRVPDQSTVAHE